MGHGIKWDGANKTYGPPPGVTEDQCHTLHVFFNGYCIVSCWELTDEEIADIVRTRRVFQSVWSNGRLPPTLVGSESVVHATVADFGAVWRLGGGKRDDIIWSSSDLTDIDKLNMFNHAAKNNMAVEVTGKPGWFIITSIDVVDNNKTVEVRGVEIKPTLCKACGRQYIGEHHCNPNKEQPPS